MVKLTALRHPVWSLKRKLFVCMLLLAVLLLALLAAGLILFGQTSSTEDWYYDALTMQMEVFGKDISTHFDHVAASAIALSEEMTGILEDSLAGQALPFSRLTDSPGAIAALQSAMIGPLRQRMLQTDCSGAFVLLNATVNSSLPDASFSRTGLYLQTNGYRLTDPEVLLYRGLTDIARANGIQPHRKWRLEFRTDHFPGDSAPLSGRTYRISRPITLPGTSDQVLLLTVPLTGADGTDYGLCGYEISASYFMTHHAQPSVLPRLICLLAVGGENQLATGEALHCGGTDGYFCSLTDEYTIRRTERGFSLFLDDHFSYIGLTRPIDLESDEEQHLLAVMVPKADYDRAKLVSRLKTALLMLLLLFATVHICRALSRRFLSPLLTALEQIQSDKRQEASSDIPEILDLIAWLDRQDKAHGETITALEKRRQESESENLRLQSELERLAYSRKTEIDPADYTNFLNGLQTLTKTERNLFAHYLSGKSAQEILALTGIKESTLKYHNHNLLGKLGVSSRKQMLRYAEIMLQQGEESLTQLLDNADSVSTTG